jgi:hypothetical protein
MGGYVDSSSQPPVALRIIPAAVLLSAGDPITIAESVPTPGKIEPGSFSTPIGEATVIPYTPAAPTRWSSPIPATVAAALDDVGTVASNPSQSSVVAVEL